MNDIIQGLIFTVISGQLYMIYKTYKADHERRKIQSTIEYLHKIKKLYRPIKKKINSEFDRDHIINLIDIKRIENLESKIEEILSVIEHLSVGVNTGVYDFHILNRMSGNYLIKLFEQFSPFINKAQERNKTTYIEFLHVYGELKKISLADKSQQSNLKYV